MTAPVAVRGKPLQALRMGGSTSFIRNATAWRVSPFAAMTLVCAQLGSCGGRQGAIADASSTAPSSSAVASASIAPSAAPSPAPATPPAFDLASVHRLIDLPALAEVAHALHDGDASKAAQLLSRAIDATAIPAGELDRAQFLLGNLALRAKDEAGADAAYAKVSTSSPLAIYAALRRAPIVTKAGHAADAIALLERVPDVAPFAVDRHMALGEAQAAIADHASAAASFAFETRGPRWVDASIRFAEEVAVAAPAVDARAMEAATAARRVKFEAPTSPLAARAEVAERGARARLSGADAAVPPASIAEQEARVQALFDAGRMTEVEKLAPEVIAQSKPGDGIWCAATVLLARVEEHKRHHAEALVEYGKVSDRCVDDATAIPAIYEAGKIAASSGKDEIALRDFALISKRAPRHRLADDATLRAGTLLVDRGETAKGEAMIASIPDVYPDGDMRTEALFRLALPRMKRGDWAGALPFLAQSIKLVPREDGYFVADRAAYFLARAKLETGAGAEGVAALLDVIHDGPLTFAGAMAYARLGARSPEDAAAASRALHEALNTETVGALFDLHRPELASAPFLRAVELLRVGEVDASRRELSLIGMLKESDADGAWLSASLFAQAGELRTAFSIARNRSDWLHHAPAGAWKSAWMSAFPRIYDDVVETAARADDVPSALVWAVMREESAFDPAVISGSDAYGLMQLIAPTAAHYAKALKLPSDPRSLAQPEINIPIGASYLKKLRAEFASNPALAVPSYNAGEGATRRWMATPLAASFDLWVESIPFDETRKYTKRVLASYFAYLAIYDPGHLDQELRISAGK